MPVLSIMLMLTAPRHAPPIILMTDEVHSMPYIELTGHTLMDLINDGEVNPEELHQAGVASGSILRVNVHGELEVRQHDRWELVGGLLGNYEDRLRKVTGFDWV